MTKRKEVPTAKYPKRIFDEMHSSALNDDRMRSKKVPTLKIDRERANAPYVINQKRPCRLVRNYDMLPPTHHVNNLFVLDYIDCDTPKEAEWMKGLLWNAFAGGRLFSEVC